MKKILYTPFLVIGSLVVLLGILFKALGFLILWNTDGVFYELFHAITLAEEARDYYKR